MRLEFYSSEELGAIVSRNAAKFGIAATDDGAHEIARRARGTPRVAGRLLRRVRDFAEAEGADRITAAVADRALKRLEVDAIGLDSLDRRYLKALVGSFAGGPVGVETLAAALAEARDALEDVVEPFLIQQGFIQRTPRGRLAAPRAYEHLGFAPPVDPAGKPDLFK